MLKIGIVGLPNVGKSTLFKALTKQQVNISNYPFCTINPNIGVVKVPDKRFERLCQAFCRPKIVPPIVEFVDIAGLVKDAHKGQGLGNQFLAHIREVDAIVEVVRFFEREDVIHVEKTVNPERDIEILENELIAKDLETIEKRLQKLEKQLKTHDKKTQKEYELLTKIRDELKKGKKVIDLNLDEQERLLIKDLFLLTAKPILYIYNVSQKVQIPSNLKEKNHIVLDLKLEEELDSLSESEKEELGVKSNLDDLIKKAYQLLDLIIFYTFNEKEIHAWETKRGTRAPEAGGLIHSDFEEKFIRAEVIQWEKLIEAGSWQKAKEKGMIKIVGHDYIVQDGDVIYFII